MDVSKATAPRVGRRLLKCFVCNTEDPKLLRNKMLVAICVRCQRLKTLKGRFTPSKVHNYELERTLVRLLTGQPINADLVRTGISLLRNGKVEILISRAGNQYRLVRLRPDGNGEYISEEVLLSI